MKLITALIVLQAITASAVPFHKRAACGGPPRQVTSVATVTPDAVTVTQEAAAPAAEPTTQQPAPVVETTSPDPVPVVETTSPEPAPVVETTSSEPAPVAETTVQAPAAETTAPAPAPAADTTTTQAVAETTTQDSSVSPTATFASESTTATISTTSTVVPSVEVSTTVVETGTVQVLPSLSTTVPDTTGSVQTSLETSGNPTQAPVLSTTIEEPSSTLSTVATVTTFSSLIAPTPMVSANIFQPVATDAPPAVIGQRSDHPVPRLGIQQTTPIETNKFYQNFFLGNQNAASWTHPYSVAWAKGAGASSSWGLAVSHVDADQRVFGSGDPAPYYINPAGIQSLVLSAAELGSTTTLTTDSLTQFSINVNLLANAGDASPAITFPLVQGMGFLTAIYNGGTPTIQSGVFFRTLTRISFTPKSGVTKYSIVLEDGKTWFLYAHAPSGASLELQVVSNGLIQASSNWNGVVQVAKNPCGSACEALYDDASGAYATTATLTGSVSGAAGSYSIAFSRAGRTDANLLMFALPHHVESFDGATKGAVTSLQLQTTTKGMATAVTADAWTLNEQLPTNMDFAPWRPDTGSQSQLSDAAIAAIQEAAASEVSQDMDAQSNLDSFYFSGKALAKFAGIVYTLNDIAKNQALAQAGLIKLKEAFERFATNTNVYPLVYETAWKGVVSTGTYVTGDAGKDFGNTYYNDHHFHFGYFVYAAAVIGYLDPTWVDGHKDYVNTLVRDYANPSSADPYFPVYRNFDWFHGHSWAHGLYESWDGRDQESSSEDTMSAYALKMWGRTVGDANLEARGNLQLAVSARSLQHYYLYASNNVDQPSNFIGNKVAGILFENKVDHTTYFGTNIEYIQGIHMIPLLPMSALARTKQFVQEEWDTYFNNGRVDNISGGWRGILYSNLAIIDPVTSFNFFSQPNFDASWLDGGASRTWYLAFAAGLGGA